MTKRRNGYNLRTMTKLKIWCENNTDAVQSLIKELGCHEKSFMRYKSGSRIPEPDSMRLIYAFTDGEVDPNSFYDLPELSRSKSKGTGKRKSAAAH